MSQPRGFGLNGTKLYSNISKPMEINLNFVVDSANGNGLGIRSLKSNGYVDNVFMHTSATPGVGNGGKTNPNPAAGYAIVQMRNTFNGYIGGFNGQINPLASTNLTSTTTHNPYVITSLGTTTLAQWQTAGLPAGITPTVGQAFIALATGSIGGSGTVGAPGVPTVINCTVIGDPNQTVTNSSVAANAGAYLILQFTGATNSSTTTLVATNPPDGSVISLQCIFDGSTVTIDGL